ncbi:Dihydrodipicolinate synthase [Nitrospina gracilis 3/211]|uniref:4-hydroxy-tetrahydrodipicolinate synthase n=1 Tax=Nitrospina gracilis (strain 3/211) TaxID=1266370 RepID=M1YJ03_NITG3|nr:MULTISPECIES: 4-hydroxy-tetrahydrodipicolinate synthase [Nitrospina]MCF8723424.1 4-hydroxy-tetrahydrodipicolinate synthase [Nitrospina sp. Nb-3]CCQ90484.1 Dihydrodipicolinate synthase [Nitrospina gracilis 3/211]
MFEGSLVAIVTPFRNGRVDEQAFEKLLQFHIDRGTQGVVPCGTTGESATLTHEEHHQVIRQAVEVCKGKIPVLAGTGSNSTAEAIELTRHAEEIGADGSLLITPYYNKPSQEGLYQHFTAVAKETNLPIILYNVPGRTSVNMLPPTVERLAKENKNIVGIKEASGDLMQISEVVERCGDDFVVLSGDDGLLWPILAVGGKGVISVTANVVPEKMAALCQSSVNADMKTARQLHYELMALNDALFMDTNPVPVKAALWLMGMISDELRPPLAKLSSEHMERLKTTLKQYSLL